MEEMEKGEEERGGGREKREGRWRREERTYSLVTLTPPCSPLENTPFPLPPARICAFNTTSRTPDQHDRMRFGNLGTVDIVTSCCSHSR